MSATEIDELLAAGLGEQKHFVALHAAVHRHDKVGTGAADDVAEIIVAAEHRSIGRRLALELAIGRDDHAMDIDLMRTPFAEAPDGTTALFVPSHKDGFLPKRLGKGFAAQHAVEEPAPTTKQRSGDHAAEHAINATDRGIELQDERN